MIESIDFNAFSENHPGNHVIGTAPAQIQRVSIDSRKIQNGSGTLFVALRGTRHSGWHFATDAYRQQVRNFLLPVEAQSEELKTELLGANLLFCPDPLQALQALAQTNRQAFKGRVVGITGSNGKTIVKEWLAQVLSENYRVFKNPKSYNSQIGVPLSALGIESGHQIALLEAGISQPGEMKRLASIIQPTLGIFTSIGTAHDENFQNLDQKIDEKCRLFAGCRLIIYRQDVEKISAYLEQHFPPNQRVGWSEKIGADYTLTVKPNGKKGSRILLLGRDLSTYTFTTAFRDPASLENIRHVIVAGLVLGMSPPSLQKGLDLLRTVDMRLTAKQGKNQCRILDDSYNNDLAGLDIALEFMRQQGKPAGKKVLILSEMLQVGVESAVYEEIARRVSRQGIDLFVGVGKTFDSYRKLFPVDSKFYSDTDNLIQHLSDLNLQGDLVLVKGARAFEFERVVRLLEAHVHDTVLEINLNSLRHNFNHYRSKLPAGTKIMVMVKAFAYGSGSAEIAHHLHQIGADYLSVAYPDEGVYLRERGVELPIMVMNSAARHLDLLLRYRLEPVVYDLQTLRELAATTPGDLSIHLELDTGMRRLGLEENDLESVAALLQDHPKIRITGLFSHLAAADEAIHEAFSRQQLALFDRLSQFLMQKVTGRPLRHVLNSAGIIRFPEYALDMVRLGIGLFGVEINGMEQEKLQPAITLKTVVSQVRKLKKGETIGYGRKGRMYADGEIATLAIGYADGYDRRFGNGKAYVQIKGKKAWTIGTVCMDMCMVDVTGLDVREGDTVILFGKNPSLQQLAAWSKTIPYELLTGIGRRVKRLYVLD
ncbi:bifunctional UDP-N-acetylmuramoyl-tripeptide:D-alanyl-D-alanine ligase/alanine racemase [Cyclobacterium xiamenense]|uniref:bifunctional UDP-N-acetylmuramoyl-tripeptide:D-alanyl-D-alanine ligase/alanine racemase n=1 Tax=Cyclobacterium xiamenense TaxID=1297121 RepID=UPI0035CEE3FB